MLSLHLQFSFWREKPEKSKLADFTHSYESDLIHSLEKADALLFLNLKTLGM